MYIDKRDGKVRVIADEGKFLSVDGNKETILKDGIIYEILLDEAGTIPDYIEIPIKDAPVVDTEEVADEVIEEPEKAEEITEE